MGTKYSHLGLEERCRLRGVMGMGLSISAIARRLGRHRSTIQRELARNRCADGYRPDSAARRAWARKLRGSEIARSPRLRAGIEDRLGPWAGAGPWPRWGHASPRTSPRQIAGRARGWSSTDRSTRSAWRPSTATPAARPGGARDCPGCWRKASRGGAGDEPMAGASPPSPMARRSTNARPGRIRGAGSAIGEGGPMQVRRPRDIRLTLQAEEDRTSIQWIDVPTEALPADAGPSSSRAKDAGLAAGAIAAEPGGPPAKARRAIAGNKGGAFARHEAVTDAIGRHARFRDPHGPWQRGSIDNANGRLRRDLSRQTRSQLGHTPFGDHTDADLDDVIRNLNSTPRKCPGHRTPIEAFAASLGGALEA